MAGFQTSIEVAPAYAVEGDIASDNARAAVLSDPNTQLTTGAAGATIGRFAWIDQPTQTVSNAGAGAPQGLISRHYQAFITEWLGAASMLIPAGIPIALHQRGDFWVRSATAATVGQKVFASNTDGSVSTGAAGADVTGCTETGYTVASAGAAGELIKITSWA